MWLMVGPFETVLHSLRKHAKAAPRCALSVPYASVPCVPKCAFSIPTRNASVRARLSVSD